MRKAWKDIRREYRGSPAHFWLSLVIGEAAGLIVGVVLTLIGEMALWQWLTVLASSGVMAVSTFLWRRITDRKTAKKEQRQLRALDKQIQVARSLLVEGQQIIEDESEGDAHWVHPWLDQIGEAFKSSSEAGRFVTPVVPNLAEVFFEREIKRRIEQLSLCLNWLEGERKRLRPE